MRGYILGFLGNLYLKMFKLEKAIDCYERALKYNTKNTIAIYNYGIILLQKGDAKRALDLFEKIEILNKKPTLQKLIALAISSCYWKLNEIPKAIEILEGLIKNNNYITADILTTLGYFYLLNKEYDKALEISKSVLNDTPEYASAWDNIGQIYFAQNDLKNAKENFLKSIELNPYSADSLYYLGLLEEKEENLDKAKEYFERANKCQITSLNTFSKEDLDEKINYYKKR